MKTKTINELFEKATNGENFKEEFERYQIEQEIKDLKEGELFYCNKCNRAINKEDLNNNEIDEIKNSLKSDGVPSFVCSNCINKEMSQEDK